MMQDSISEGMQSQDTRKVYVKQFFEGIDLTDQNVEDIAEILENFKWSELDRMVAQVQEYSDKHIANVETREKLMTKLEATKKTSADMMDLVKDFAGKLFDEL